jgi:sigma-B regulation protein RsbU (phosphoserine phosphatase)
LLTIGTLLALVLLAQTIVNYQYVSNNLIQDSDGLTEATNGRDEFFGEERLIALATQNAHLPARSICHAILDAVRTFAGQRAIEDDQTLLVVRLPG